jgi:hypothetical protein
VAELINLNRARKARARDEGQAKAAENRVKFGRSKAETRLARAQADKARKDADAGMRER